MTNDKDNNLTLFFQQCVYYTVIAGPYPAERRMIGQFFTFGRAGIGLKFADCAHNALLLAPLQLCDILFRRWRYYNFVTFSHGQLAAVNLFPVYVSNP